MSEKIDNFTEKYRLVCEKWARLDGVARNLEERKKIVLAEIHNQSTAKTEKAKEIEALVSPIYQQHIDQMTKARTEANICKASVEAMKMRSDHWRTAESSRRAEMSMK